MAFSFRIGTNWCHDFPKLARESGFYFNMHRSRIHVDWNRISSIDIEQVIRDRDFLTIDENINNVIDYSLENEYNIKILDPNFVKLFRLTQLAVEYLLYCKQYLDHSVVILKDELRKKIEDNAKLKKKISALDDMIKQLKEKSKEKNKLIETKIGDSNGEIHKCPHCPKTFVSATFASAHVARRHPNISDLYVTSPLREHYRAETEKLHNEIKTLKERLNHAERIIKQESQIVPLNIKTGNEIVTSKSDENEIDRNEITQDQQKKYRDEISSLKSILFDEIYSLKQKNNNGIRQSENTSDINIKALISQQEQDIKKLTNQLLERLTPDIESMHVKLQEQESYWKSKIEYLEQQHRKDIENLTFELKRTQLATDRTKAEYESKVNNLERQSINQSSILREQHEQLTNLSHEISNTLIQHQDAINSSIEKRPHNPTKKQECSHKSYVSDNEFNQSRKRVDLGKDNNDGIIIEDIDSISSHESPSNLPARVSQRQILQKNLNIANTMEIESVTFDHEAEMQHFQKFRGTRNDIKHTKGFIHCNSDSNKVKLFPTKKNHHANDEIKFSKTHSNTHSLINSSMNTYSATNQLTNNSATKLCEIETSHQHSEKNVVSSLSINPQNDQTFSVPLEHVFEVTSQARQEYSTSESEVETDSHETSTVVDDVPKDKNGISLYGEKKMQRKAIIFEKVQENVQEMLYKQLMDLGINPQWQGIPDVTFKQKMEIIQHHQNINSKKLLNYNQIKKQMIEDLLFKISNKYKDNKNHKFVKKVALDISVGDVKTKNKNAFNAKKILSNEKSIFKLKDGSFKEATSKETTNILPQTSDRYNSFKNVSELQPSSTKKHTSNDSIFKSGLNQSPILLNKSHESKNHTTDLNEDKETFLKPTPNTYCSDKCIPEIPQYKMLVSEAKRKYVNPSDSYDSNDTNSLTMQPEVTQSSSYFSKHNKSVLKTKANSDINLVKKKVLFDLEHKETTENFIENVTTSKELSDNDWNISSISNGKDSTSQNEKSKTTDNIILKTTQSEKIAEISKRIEEQLSIQRRKPVGAIDTMFSSKNKQEEENNISTHVPVENFVSTQSSIAKQEISTRSKTTFTHYPQPAPRYVKETTFSITDSHIQLPITKDSDLDSDIDEILEVI